MTQEMQNLYVSYLVYRKCQSASQGKTVGRVKAPAGEFVLPGAGDVCNDCGPAPRARLICALVFREVSRKCEVDFTMLPGEVPASPGVLTSDARIISASRQQINEAKLPTELDFLLHSKEDWNVPNSGARHGYLSLRLGCNIVRAAFAAVQTFAPAAATPCIHQIPAQHAVTLKNRQLADKRWLLMHCTVASAKFSARLVYAVPHEFSRSYQLFVVPVPVLEIKLNLSGRFMAKLSVVSRRVFQHEPVLKLENHSTVFYGTTPGDSEASNRVFTFWLNALQSGRDNKVQYIEEFASSRRTNHTVQSECTQQASPAHHIQSSNTESKSISSANSESKVEDTIRESLELASPSIFAKAPTTASSLLKQRPRQNDDKLADSGGTGSLPQFSEYLAPQGAFEAANEAVPATCAQSYPEQTPPPTLQAGDLRWRWVPNLARRSTCQPCACLFCGGYVGPWLPRPKKIAICAHAMLHSQTACAKCFSINNDVLLAEISTALGSSDCVSERHFAACERRKCYPISNVGFTPLPNATIRPR